MKKTINVTWAETRDGGRLCCRCEEDRTLNSNVIRWPEPITARTDSHAVADAVGQLLQLEVVAVDHDREFVHVTVEA